MDILLGEDFTRSKWKFSSKVFMRILKNESEALVSLVVCLIQLQSIFQSRSLRKENLYSLENNLINLKIHLFLYDNLVSERTLQFHSGQISQWLCSWSDCYFASCEIYEIPRILKLTEVIKLKGRKKSTENHYHSN